MGYERELQAAVQAVAKASRLCERVYREMVAARDQLAKQDRSPVTLADFCAQAVVSLELSRLHHDPLCAEEDTGALAGPEAAPLRSALERYVAEAVPGATGADVLSAIDRGAHAGGGAGRFWTLDPIDGTKGFLRGEQYAVALALVEDGEIVLGVLGCPRLLAPGGDAGVLMMAERGAGARQRALAGGDERPIQVTDIADPARAVVCESVESGHSSHGDAARVAETLGITAPPLRMDSQAKYAAVARGDASIYLRLPTRKGYEEKIWDHAAGALIVREAGGRVSDIRGRALDFAQGRTLRANLGVVATGGRIHDRVIEAIAAAVT
jgi:3'(2'), 5'-bisphosphate nucleotidase